MKILFHNYHEELNDNNRLFRQRNVAVGDDLLRPFHALEAQAARKGMTVGTLSAIPLDQADAIVFIDRPDVSRPHVQRMMDSGKPLYLMVLESILIRPVNIFDHSIDRFTKIFTYNDSHVDDDRFIKINYSFELPDRILVDMAGKSKLCTMIAGHKNFSHPDELYSKRVEAIRWFEKHHPEDFDLYGMGWGERDFGAKFPLRVLNRFRFLRRLAAARYPSYRGAVERKRPVLERYKFAVCYENVKNVPGYITEKIFDCFFAGCVPIYWGADNVDRYIPGECYIDRRKFNSYGELYDHLKDMTDAHYLGYIKNINLFLESPQAHKFSTDFFAQTMTDNFIL